MSYCFGGKFEMTEKELVEIEIAYFQEQIKVKQKKLKELEQTKSPVEEAYKNWYGEYPTNTWQGDVNRWDAFQAGYNAAYERKVSEEPEEQKWDAVRESVRWCEQHPDKDPLDCLKPQTLHDVCREWCDDDENPPVSVLIDRIDKWLPTEHDTNSYKWNECIRIIREKLR